MKKVLLLGMGLLVAFAFSSCKSSESAYKKAYEKAKQQELAEPKEATPVETVTQVVSAPVQRTQPVSTGDARQEKVSVVSGNGLQDFSVVCGSFGVKTNADNLKATLDRDGYNTIIVFNADRAMYRVIVGTYSDYDSAAKARDAFKAKYPNRQDFQGSWVLYRVQ